MNSNDRYAVIALMFLLVIVAVAVFWDDGGEAHAASPGGAEVAALDEQRPPAPERGTYVPERGGLPLGGSDELPPISDRVRTQGLRDDGHRVEPGVRGSGLGTDAFDGPVPAERLAPERVPEAPLLPRRPEGESGFLKPPTPAPREDANRVTPSAPKEPKAAPIKKDTPKKSAGPRIHVVQPGDSLSAIAVKKCGTSEAIDEIARLNGLDDIHTIHEGDELLLPARRSSASSTGSKAVASAPKPEAKGRRTVTIVKGEALSLVLDRELGSYIHTIALVEALNPGLDRNRIREGQEIILPLPSEIPEKAKTKVARGETPRPARKKKTGNYVR